jgi:hypothetical protein
MVYDRSTPQFYILGADVSSLFIVSLALLLLELSSYIQTHTWILSSLLVL